MTAKFVLGVGLAAALAFGAVAASARDSASQKFIKEAVEGNLAEVQMGQLAQKNGTSDGVKSFGQMLEQDHGAANQKATTVATASGVNPPASPNAKQKAAYDMMAKLTGAKFDSEFVKHMIADHKKDIADYEKAAKAQDDVGRYATETLPTLRKHLETAQSLAPAPTTGKR